MLSRFALGFILVGLNFRWVVIVFRPLLAKNVFMVLKNFVLSEILLKYMILEGIYYTF